MYENCDSVCVRTVCGVSRLCVSRKCVRMRYAPNLTARVATALYQEQDLAI